MKTAGTESHPNVKIKTSENPTSIKRALFSLKLKFLNFILSKGMVEIISHGNKMQIVYSTHLLVRIACMLNGLYKSKRGNEAINKPATGVGKPSKLFLWVMSMLNLAKRQAAAIGKSKAGRSHSAGVSNPDGSAANEIRSN